MSWKYSAFVAKYFLQEWKIPKVRRWNIFCGEIEIEGRAYKIYELEWQTLGFRKIYDWLNKLKPTAAKPQSSRYISRHNYSDQTLSVWWSLNDYMTIFRWWQVIRQLSVEIKLWTFLTIKWSINPKKLAMLLDREFLDSLTSFALAQWPWCSTWSVWFWKSAQLHHLQDDILVNCEVKCTSSVLFWCYSNADVQQYTSFFLFKFTFGK